MRVLAAALLLLLAAFSAAASWGALSNLVADYQDSSTLTYLLFGVPWLVLAAAAVVLAMRLLRRR